METQTGDKKGKGSVVTALRAIATYQDPDWLVQPVGEWETVEEWFPFAWDDPLIEVTVLDANVPEWDADVIVELHDRFTGERAHYLARLA